MGSAARRTTGFSSALRSTFHDWLIYSKLYLAVIAATEVIFVLAVLGSGLNVAPLVVALITTAIYVNDQLVDLSDDDIAHTREREFVSENADLLYVFASVSYGVALSLSVFGGVVSFAVALVPGVAWIVYASGLIRSITDRVGIGFTRLKELFLINTILVALTWSLTVIVLPLGYLDGVSEPVVATLFVYFFLRVFTNTEIANVPDVEEDQKRGIATVPTRLGIRRTRWALHLIDALSGAVVVSAAALGILPRVLTVPFLLALGYSTVVTARLEQYSDSSTLGRLAEYEYVVMFLALVAVIIVSETSFPLPEASPTLTGITVVLMLSIWLGMSVGLLAYREYPEPGALPLVVLLVGQVWWSVTLFLELQAGTFIGKLVFAEIRWIGIPFIPVGWVLFAAEYTGRRRYLQPRYLTALLVIPVLTAIFALTSPYNSLLYESSTVTEIGGASLLDRSPGPWFWVITAYTYVLGIAGAIMLIGLIREETSLPFRGQTVALLVGLAAPLLSNLLFLADKLSQAAVLPSAALDPTPLAFSVSGLAYLGAISRFQLLGDSPTPSPNARHVAFEQMEQAAVVVDRNDFIIDMNPKAAQTLVTSTDEAVGEPAREFIPEYEKIKSADESEPVTVEDTDRRRSFECATTSVTDPYGRVVSRIVTLNDVSRYLRRQQQLTVLNRVFRHNVRTQSQVILSNVDRLDTQAPDSSDADSLDEIKDSAAEIVSIGDKIREMINVFQTETEGGEGVRVDQLLRSCRQAVEQEYPRVEVEISSPDTEVAVPAVARPVFENAIENAAHHNTGPDPWVRINATADDGWLRVSVADNGPGIDEYEAAVIEDGQETQLDHTSGLGLWIIAWGTDLAGGTVSFEERDDGGTVVSVEIPVLPTPVAGTETENASSDGRVDTDR